jgi:catechol 2,3-dioxygenase-like lactoylglutathione lyase family enzyme
LVTAALIGATILAIPKPALAERPDISRSDPEPTSTATNAAQAPTSALRAPTSATQASQTAPTRAAPGAATKPAAAVEGNQTTPAPASDGKIVGIAFVGRMVADLDKSIPFYETLGFSRDPSIDSSWRRDDGLNHLYGIKGARIRSARLTINSNVSGKPFAIYLYELRGIKRANLAGYTPWEPGASHFGIVVPDAQLVWTQLKARGTLRARSWGGELIPFPGQTQGSLAYMTDPDGLDIELINQRPATPAQDGRPARPAIPPGLSHVGLVVLDSDKETAFYGNLLGGRLAETSSPWLQGDFYDSAVGGHGNILRFHNESFAEAADPGSLMHFELVEFQNRKKAVASYRISDISVGYVGFEVQDIDALLSRVKGAGAQVVSDGGVVTLKDGGRAVLVRDPDVGGFIELFEPAGRGR